MQGKANKDDVKVFLAAVAETHKVAVVPGRLLPASKSPAACSLALTTFAYLIWRNRPAVAASAHPSASRTRAQRAYSDLSHDIYDRS